MNGDDDLKMVRITLDIEQDTHERLSTLGEQFGKDVTEIIDEILDTISFYSDRIVDRSKDYEVQITLRTVISHVLSESRQTSNSLFDKILEGLEAKGHFVPDDMQFDLDEMSIWINYAGLLGSELLVDELDVTLSGLKRLIATHLIENKKIDDAALASLDDLTKDVGYLDLPEGFYDLEDYSIEFIEDDDYSRLEIYVAGESLEDLPAIPEISDMMKQILSKVGILEKIQDRT